MTWDSRVWMEANQRAAVEAHLSVWSVREGALLPFPDSLPRTTPDPRWEVLPS